MRGGKVQINWHDRQPVLTVDFHRVSRRLATGGGDHVIKIWEIASDGLGKKPLSVSHLSSLFGHRSAVNVVRFSPCGNYLASGADGGGITLWKLHITDDGESWKVHRLLVSHCNDVLDLQWSSDGAFLVSASADNTCVIWNHTCAVEQILQGHSHHVQGVAWDPLGQYKATLSSDRTCKIFANKPQGKSTNVEKINFLCQHTLVKAEDQNDSKPRVKTHLFHDETLPSAYRRLAWSPDGSFVVMPAGLGKYSSEVINTAYVMSRRDLSRPEIQLLGAKKAVVAIRFCSVSFSLHESESDNLFKVPHRAVFAVATLDSLYVYDTETFSPLQTLTGLHRGAITDIAWSSDAKYLALSSQDGYCTFFEFKNEELGQPHILPGIKEPAKMTRHQSIPFSAKKIQIVETKDLGKRGKFSMSKPANIDPQLSTEVFLDLDHNPDHIYRLEVMKKCSHRNVLRLEGIIAIGPEKSIGVLVEPYSGLLWTYISKNMDLADLLNVVPSVDLQNIIRSYRRGYLGPHVR